MARRRNVRPGVEHDRRQPDKPPVFRFFKIILSTPSELNKLRIPCKFVQKFGDELGDSADLVLPNGSVWKVGLLKAQNGIWFNDGWKSFSDHHSIGHGHFLVFAYTGPCSFKVVIFDKTASEVEYPSNNQSPTHQENSVTQNEVGFQDNNPSEVLNSVISATSISSLNSKLHEASAKKRDSSETHTNPEQKLQMKKSFGQVYTRNKKPKVEPLDEIIHVDDNDSMRKNLGECKFSNLDKSLATEQDRKRAKCQSRNIKPSGACNDQETETVSRVMFQYSKLTRSSERAMADAAKYQPKRPSFMVVLRKYNCSSRRLYVPRIFNQHLNEAPKCIKLQLFDGREWEAELIREGSKRVDIGAGWNIFMRDNDLDMGDVCVVELTKKKDVLRVSIFHATEGVEHEP